MSVCLIGESHNSLLNILFHSLTHKLDRKRAPIAVIAKGKPLHFSTIWLPISSSCGYALKLPLGNAYFANSDQQSFF
jgi:hypothetical protein